MKVNQFTLIRTAALLAGAAFVLANVRAADDQEPAFANNYIKVTAEGASPSGSTPAFQRYTQQSKSGAAGIEDFNYNYDLSKDVNLDVNGKAMANNADYLADFKVSKTDFGTLEAGYRRFRTFYDDIGGFFPQNNVWLPINRRPLYVDRGKFFVDASLTLPKAPVFTFKYTNETRSGTKDTTIWGDSDLTGVPVWSQSSRNFQPAARKILPAYIQLGERQQTWEATMKQTFGNTSVMLMVGGDKIDNQDSRQIDRYIGELKPYPAIPSNPPTLVPNNFVNNPNYGMDSQGFDESGYTLGGKVETVVNDQITVYANLDYRHATADIDASRLIVGPLLTGAGLVTPVGSFTTGGRPPYSYTSTGSLRQGTITGNIGLQWKPLADLYVDAAVRGEQYWDSGHNNAVYVNNYVVPTTGAVTQQLVVAPQWLLNEEKPWTPALDLRYTGIKTLALYGSWDYRTSTQQENTGYGSINPGGAVILPTNSNGGNAIKERHANVKLGANWTPVPVFTGRAEYFVKDHENKFTGTGDDLGSFYNLTYDIQGVKLSAIFRPLAPLALTTRYVVQSGKDQIADDATGTNSSAGRSHIYMFGETIDWNPSKSIYVQANANFVYNTIITSYPQVTGLAQTVLHNSDNNYWDGNVVVGYAVDKQTDLQLGGTYYRSDNWNPDLAFFTQPYGMGERAFTLYTGVKYRYDSKTEVNAKIGYIERDNDTSGGYVDFRGPAAYVSVTRAF